MTTYQQLRDAGLSKQQLYQWTYAGLLKTSDPNPKPGRGKRRVWLPGEDKVAEMMIKLVDQGLRPSAAERVVRNGGWLAPGIRIVFEEGERRDDPRGVPARSEAGE